MHTQRQATCLGAVLALCRGYGGSGDPLVGGREVQAEAAGSGGDEEQEQGGRGVEVVAELLAVLLAGAAVQARKVVARARDQLLDDVEHLHAVAEQQHLQGNQKLVTCAQQVWSLMALVPGTRSGSLPAGSVSR